jgi:acyl carrier protein phosphodiesterase
MNHLAHLVLAGPDPGLRLGALLGDHVKGRAAVDEWPARWAAGIRLHRHIDSECDRHPAVLGFLAGLEGRWRRYGGVILDVLFDTMLTRHWQRFGPGPLPEFGAEIDALFEVHRHRLPPRLQLFSVWACERSLWQRYADRAMLGEIFRRIASRHGRASPLERGLELLDRYDPEIEGVFLELFADLSADTRHWRAGLGSAAVGS